MNRLNPAKSQRDLLLATSQTPFSLNPTNLIRLPVVDSTKPKITINNIADLLPSWGNPSRIETANNNSNTQEPIV